VGVFAKFQGEEWDGLVRYEGYQEFGIQAAYSNRNAVNDLLPTRQSKEQT
jgi:hypothetical protein